MDLQFNMIKITNQLNYDVTYLEILIINFQPT